MCKEFKLIENKIKKLRKNIKTFKYHEGYPMVFLNRKFLYFNPGWHYIHRMILGLKPGDLPSAHVHHIDRNKKNYSINNLKIIDIKKHKELHKNYLHKDPIVGAIDKPFVPKTIIRKKGSGSVGGYENRNIKLGKIQP